MSKIKKDEIKKILCIKPRGIGDIILSTIILENIKAALPHSEIHYLTEDFAKRSVQNNPHVTKVLSFNRNDFVFKIIRLVRIEKYDLIFDLWSNPKTAQITFFSGAKYRVGFAYRGRKYAYNIKVESADKILHSAEVNLQLLTAVNIPTVSKNINYYLTEDEKESAFDFFSKNFGNDDLVIGIVPSGGWTSKRCDVDKWIEFCEKIFNNLKNKFLILWGPGDESDATQIYSKLKNNSVLAPQTDVGSMAGLINQCNLIIANDSGPMHIAAALKVPTLGIFGPTDPKLQGPFSSNSDYIIKDDLHCIICNKLECPFDHECMKQLDADLLLNKVNHLLKSVKTIS